MIDDKKCREVLQRKIEQINLYKPKVIKQLSSYMSDKYGVVPERVFDIFNKIEPIESMPYNMLYKLMESIYYMIKNEWDDHDSEDFITEKYFTKIEKKEYSKPFKKREIKGLDIVIKAGYWHYTNYIYPYNYITIHTDVNEVNKWRDYNRLRFNPETQRDLIVIETKGMPIKKLDVNEDSVKEIQTSMFTGDYFPVPGVININPEHNDKDIIIKDGDLIFPSDVKMDLLEGFHNYIAETELKDHNADWNFPCEFRIVFLNTEAANRYIKQMDKKNHFSEEQTKRMDKSDNVTYVISQLNSENGFYLRGTIDNKMFVYLYDIVKSLFEVKTSRDKAFFIENIKEKINKIITKTDHFDNPLNKNEWFGYLYIISKTDNDEFNKIIENKNIYKTISSLNIEKSPSRKHYNLLNDLIKEVI